MLPNPNDRKSQIIAHNNPNAPLDQARLDPGPITTNTDSQITAQNNPRARLEHGPLTQNSNCQITAYKIV